MSIACASAPTRVTPSVQVAPPTPTPVSSTLESAKSQWGGVILYSDDAGIHALTPRLEPIATLTPTPGAFLRVDAARAALLFLAPGRLVSIDLRTGAERMVARLPELHHACLSGDPVEHVHDEGDVVIDDHYACITARDRNVNMQSYAVQLRVDLATGAVEQQTTLALGACKGAPKNAWVCAAPKLRADADASPSGRWTFERSSDIRELGGDYVYSGALLHDRKDGRTYAITKDALVALAAPHERPEGLCMLAGEAHAGWLSDLDVLLVEGCNNEASTLVIAPLAATKKLAATSFAVW